MMGEYHVHVYRVVGMMEFTVEGTEETALAMALKWTKAKDMGSHRVPSGWEKPDCKRLAFIPKVGAQKAE